MAGKTYLVTGAGRGIGTAIVERILNTQADSRVIVTARDTQVETIKRLASENGDRVVVVRYDAGDEKSPLEAAKNVREKGITAVDVIIANAGLVSEKDLTHEAEAKEVRKAFEINVVAVLLLYQSFRDLMQKSSQTPIFVALSSSAGSITLQKDHPFHMTSYTISKAAVNMLVRRISEDEKWLCAFVVHPGQVVTDGLSVVVGAQGAQENLRKGLAITKETSAERIIDIIQDAKQSTHSGNFYNAQRGGEMPW